MKQKFLNSFRLRAVALLAIFCAGVSVAWGEDPLYTLSFTKLTTGTNYNSYTNYHSITCNEVGWSVRGNQSVGEYIRVGGKNTTATDCPLISTDVLSSTKKIGKVVINHDGIGNGKNSTITINSITVEGSTNSSFENSISKTINSPSVSVQRSGTLEFIPEEEWAASSYFKITVNYKIVGSNNCYLTINTIDFYEATSAPLILADNVDIAYNVTSGSIGYTINNPVANGSLTAATTADWITLGNISETVPFTCQANDVIQAREATVTLTYTYNTNETTTKNVTITQAGNPNAPGSQNTPYTVAQARAAIDANAGITGVYATGIVTAIPTAYNSDYNNVTFNFVDNKGDNNFLQAYRCGGNEAANIKVGDEVVVYGNLTYHQGSQTYEFAQGCTLVSLTHPVSTEPSVTVDPATINATYAGGNGTLELTYENIPEPFSFDYYFCDVNGGELQGDEPDWIYAEITEPAGDEGYSVSYIIDANNGEARTAYFKVYTTIGDELNPEEVYAIVTVNQEEYVAPTYAELPFSFNGGRADIENTDGLYQEGLGTDYNANTNPTTKLKFDGTGDYLLLQFNERPGTLAFDIKGNTFSGGTFKVQTSEDGITYTDLKTYTELTDTQNEEFDNLGENVRYIKWIYTEKSSGNVGLGNIVLQKPSTDATLVITPAEVAVGYEGVDDGTLDVTTANMNNIFGAYLVYYDPEDTETSIDVEPDWIQIGYDWTQEPIQLSYTVEENLSNESRTACFKYVLMCDEGPIESNLVTITQAAAPAQYELTIEPFENLEMFTYLGDVIDPVLDGSGILQVLEGTEVMISVGAESGYVLQSLIVDGENVTAHIDETGAYTFTMPDHDVTITATAVEDVAPAGGNYVRITSLDQLTDGCKVIIAARYDEEHTNGYYAMPGETSGRPTGVAFTSETSGNDEILPATITASEDTYYWTVNVTNDGYTFTNADGQMIGYTTSTNFATGGNNTAWTIVRETAEETAMVAEYTGFVIRNGNTNTRAFAFNGTAFGAYATTNMNAAGYNFFLDFFVQTEAVEPETATITFYNECYDVDEDNVTRFYVTYSNESAFVVPNNDDLIVSEIALDEEGKFVVESYKPGAIVPANTGVLVSALQPEEYDIVLSDEEGESIFDEDNCLRHTNYGPNGIMDDQMEAADSDCTYYRLSMYNGTDIGFWWGADKGAAFSLAPNKAYMVVPNSIDVKGFAMNDIVDCIKAIETQKAEGNVIYNLAGQRVSKMQKGIYVVNGKKVLVK